MKIRTIPDVLSVYLGMRSIVTTNVSSAYQAATGAATLRTSLNAKKTDSKSDSGSFMATPLGIRDVWPTSTTIVYLLRTASSWHRWVTSSQSYVSVCTHAPLAISQTVSAVRMAILLTQGYVLPTWAAIRTALCVWLVPRETMGLISVWHAPSKTVQHAVVMIV